MTNRFPGRLITLLVILLSAGHGWSSIQEDLADETFVTISPIAGPAASEVMLPLYLNLAREKRLASLDLTLSFDRHLTSFVRFDASLVTEMASLEVETGVTEGDGPEEARLEVRLAGGASGSVVLPSGLLGYLVFQVSPQTDEGTLIPLDAAVEAEVVTDSGSETESLPILDGEITVGPPVVYSCFFYMH